MNLDLFNKLTSLFNSHGFRLYMVGGGVRDYLLGKEFDDYDFVSDATPKDMKTFLIDANYAFERFGTVIYKIDGVKAEITTLRVEGDYIDYRHPSKVKFVKTPKEDYVRRDFTINALYLDEKLNVIDYCFGQEDLKNKLIRFIGDPDTRIKEDPLRILRAERFEKKLGFNIEQKTFEAIQRNRYLLDELNPEKVKQELRKN